ncbi:MAG: hypothetical protein K9L68_12145 [Spirochaetales bacterium]|nr:hypothetical protein [Spirochaetales bacterium]MCF7939342.1 hypothetical protein [Spirochaetales bacterium]
MNASHAAENSEHDEPKPGVLYDFYQSQSPPPRVTGFAGVLLPLWFSSIAEEHRATRELAGLFDCTHMAVFRMQGPAAGSFLDAVTTGAMNTLETGRARYSFLPAPDAHILDDVIVYRLGEEDFLLVANAANAEAVETWFASLRAGEQDDLPEGLRLLLSGEDGQMSGDALRLEGPGESGLVDIAVQGPKSYEVLSALLSDEEAKQVSALRPFRVTSVSHDVIEGGLIVAATGYTGARSGYELFVDKSRAVGLWQLLLEKGEEAGLAPCGLGARDSLRIEAGLPLYGHELEGNCAIDPAQAGYGWAVDFTKPDFIGKTALRRRIEGETALENSPTGRPVEVARAAFPGGRGVRPIRAGDGILDAEGLCVGEVLSSTRVGERQIVLAFMESEHSKPKTPAGLFYLARNERQRNEGRAQKTPYGQQVQADLNGGILERFERF